MSQQPETLFKQRVVKKLKEFNDRVWFVKVQQLAVRGTPDLIICCKGFFFAWELKVNSNKATKLQQHQLDLIDAAGGVARVVTPDNFEECLEELRCRVL